MKLYLLLTALFLSFSFAATAQITKADVEKMMQDIGTSAEKIETLWVGNRMAFYNDGRSNRTSDKYMRESGDYANTIEVLDSGILLKTKKDGQEYSRTLYPYASISYVFVSLTSLDIHLRD